MAQPPDKQRPVILSMNKSNIIPHGRPLRRFGDTTRPKTHHGKSSTSMIRQEHKAAVIDFSDAVDTPSTSVPEAVSRMIQNRPQSIIESLTTVRPNISSHTTGITPKGNESSTSLFQRHVNTDHFRPGSSRSGMRPKYAESVSTIMPSPMEQTKIWLNQHKMSMDDFHKSTQDNLHSININLQSLYQESSSAINNICGNVTRILSGLPKRSTEQLCTFPEEAKMGVRDDLDVSCEAQKKEISTSPIVIEQKSEIAIKKRQNRTVTSSCLKPFITILNPKTMQAEIRTIAGEESVKKALRDSCASPEKFEETKRELDNVKNFPSMLNVMVTDVMDEIDSCVKQVDELLGQGDKTYDGISKKIKKHRHSPLEFRKIPSESAPSSPRSSTYNISQFRELFKRIDDSYSEDQSHVNFEICFMQQRRCQSAPTRSDYAESQVYRKRAFTNIFKKMRDQVDARDSLVFFQDLMRRARDDIEKLRPRFDDDEYVIDGLCDSVYSHPSCSQFYSRPSSRRDSNKYEHSLWFKRPKKSKSRIKSRKLKNTTKISIKADKDIIDDCHMPIANEHPLTESERSRMRWLSTIDARYPIKYYDILDDLRPQDLKPLEAEYPLCKTNQDHYMDDNRKTKRVNFLNSFLCGEGLEYEKLRIELLDANLKSSDESSTFRSLEKQNHEQKMNRDLVKNVASTDEIDRKDQAALQSKVLKPSEHRENKKAVTKYLHKFIHLSDEIEKMTKDAEHDNKKDFFTVMPVVTTPYDFKKQEGHPITDHRSLNVKDKQMSTMARKFILKTMHRYIFLENDSSSKPSFVYTVMPLIITSKESNWTAQQALQVETFVKKTSYRSRSQEQPKSKFVDDKSNTTLYKSKKSANTGNTFPEQSAVQHGSSKENFFQARAKMNRVPANSIGTKCRRLQYKNQAIIKKVYQNTLKAQSWSPSNSILSSSDFNHSNSKLKLTATEQMSSKPKTNIKMIGGIPAVDISDFRNLHSLDSELEIDASIERLYRRVMDTRKHQKRARSLYAKSFAKGPGEQLIDLIENGPPQYLPAIPPYARPKDLPSKKTYQELLLTHLKFPRLHEDCYNDKLFGEAKKLIEKETQVICQLSPAAKKRKRGVFCLVTNSESLLSSSSRKILSSKLNNNKFLTSPDLIPKTTILSDTKDVIQVSSSTIMDRIEQVSSGVMNEIDFSCPSSFKKVEFTSTSNISHRHQEINGKFRTESPCGRRKDLKEFKTTIATKKEQRADITTEINDSSANKANNETRSNTDKIDYCHMPIANEHSLMESERSRMRWLSSIDAQYPIKYYDILDNMRPHDLNPLKAEYPLCRTNEDRMDEDKKTKTIDVMNGVLYGEGLRYEKLRNKLLDANFKSSDERFFFDTAEKQNQDQQMRQDLLKDVSSSDERDQEDQAVQTEIEYLHNLIYLSNKNDKISEDAEDDKKKDFFTDKHVATTSYEFREQEGYTTKVHRLLNVKDKQMSMKVRKFILKTLHRYIFLQNDGSSKPAFIYTVMPLISTTNGSNWASRKVDFQTFVEEASYRSRFHEQPSSKFVDDKSNRTLYKTKKSANTGNKSPVVPKQSAIQHGSSKEKVPQSRVKIDRLPVNITGVETTCRRPPSKNQPMIKKVDHNTPKSQSWSPNNFDHSNSKSKPTATQQMPPKPLMNIKMIGGIPAVNRRDFRHRYSLDNELKIVASIDRLYRRVMDTRKLQKRARSLYAKSYSKGPGEQLIDLIENGSPQYLPAIPPYARPKHPPPKKTYKEFLLTQLKFLKLHDDRFNDKFGEAIKLIEEEIRVICEHSLAAKKRKKGLYRLGTNSESLSASSRKIINSELKSNMFSSSKDLIPKSMVMSDTKDGTQVSSSGIMDKVEQVSIGVRNDVNFSRRSAVKKVTFTFTSNKPHRHQEINGNFRTEYPRGRKNYLKEFKSTIARKNEQRTGITSKINENPANKIVNMVLVDTTIELDKKTDQQMQSNIKLSASSHTSTIDSLVFSIFNTEMLNAALNKIVPLTVRETREDNNSVAFYENRLRNTLDTGTATSYSQYTPRHAAFSVYLSPRRLGFYEPNITICSGDHCFNSMRDNGPPPNMRPLVDENVILHRDWEIGPSIINPVNHIILPINRIGRRSSNSRALPVVASLITQHDIRQSDVADRQENEDPSGSVYDISSGDDQYQIIDEVQHNNSIAIISANEDVYTQILDIEQNSSTSCLCHGSSKFGLLEDFRKDLSTEDTPDFNVLTLIKSLEVVFEPELSRIGLVEESIKRLQSFMRNKNRSKSQIARKMNFQVEKEDQTCQILLRTKSMPDIVSENAVTFVSSNGLENNNSRLTQGIESGAPKFHQESSRQKSFSQECIHSPQPKESYQDLTCSYDLSLSFEDEAFASLKFNNMIATPDHINQGSNTVYTEEEHFHTESLENKSVDRMTIEDDDWLAFSDSNAEKPNISKRKTIFSSNSLNEVPYHLNFGLRTDDWEIDKTHPLVRIRKQWKKENKKVSRENNHEGDPSGREKLEERLLNIIYIFVYTIAYAALVFNYNCE